MTLGSAGSTTPSDLRGLTRFITRTTSSGFSDTNIDALLNNCYHEFVNEVKKHGGNIDFNMVTETINLANGTQTYSVTGKVLTIKRIEVTYDGTNWRFVRFFDLSQRHLPTDTTSVGNDFSKDNPFADVYLATGEVVKIDLYPIPDAAVTNGLKVWKTLEITELSAAGDEPTLPEAYQKYLAYGAAKEHAIQLGKGNLAREMDALMAKILTEAISFYSNRSEEDTLQITSAVSTEDYA